MVFVTLGTQDKSFTRLLDALESAINNGIIKEEVVVQAGFTKFKSQNMKIFDLIDRDEFSKYIKECNLLITHGGVGSIITGLKNNKKIIAIARLAKYREHVNDHQKQIIDNFTEEGYIIGTTSDEIDFKKLIEKTKNFKPKQYISNNINMINLVEKVINE